MINFVARDGVAPAVNSMLQNLLDQVPCGAWCFAAIAKRNDVFLFEITLRSTHDTFQSRHVVDVKEERCRDRFWQIAVVRQMTEEITLQIQDWHKRRFVA